MKNLSKVSILFADNLHFHERNFKSLFEFLDNNKIKYEFASVDKSWLSLYGNYASKFSNLRSYYGLLERLSKEDLYLFEIGGFNVYEIARSEMLSYLIPQDGWVDESIQYNYSLFENIFEKEKNTLLLNMAAVCFWFDFWVDYLDSHNVYTYCGIFSGCLIYSKVLIKCLETRVTNPLLFESSFTGEDYYCEFQYGCIPNNTNLKYLNYYDRLYVDDIDYSTNVKNENKAINKIRLMNNKNVTQPLFSEDIVFNNDEKVVLILGQVINDFSILESNLSEYNSLLIYKRVVEEILNNTNHNIIFKAHPWEVKKINIYRSLTKEKLTEFVDSLDEKFTKRIVIVEDYNISKLFEICSYAIGLCSQGAIEAAYAGLKTIQLGDAFYGGKGFTYDLTDIDKIPLILNSKSGYLSLEEFTQFKKFLIKFLLVHLVSIHKSGYINLAKIFSVTDRVPLVDNKKVTTKLVEKKETQTPMLKSSISVKEIKVTDNIEIVKERITTSDSEKSLALVRKIEKFKHNPERFFSDSKYTSIRRIGYLYKAFKG